MCIHIQGIFTEWGILKIAWVECNETLASNSTISFTDNLKDALGLRRDRIGKHCVVAFLAVVAASDQDLVEDWCPVVLNSLHDFLASMLKEQPILNQVSAGTIDGSTFLDAMYSMKDFLAMVKLARFDAISDGYKEQVRDMKRDDAIGLLLKLKAGMVAELMLPAFLLNIDGQEVDEKLQACCKKFKLRCHHCDALNCLRDRLQELEASRFDEIVEYVFKLVDLCSSNQGEFDTSLAESMQPKVRTCILYACILCTHTMRTTHWVGEFQS